MELTTIFSIIFYTFFGVVVGKYVYIMENKTWGEAQEHCRQHHTDLGLINCQSDQDQILEAAAESFVRGWIGLYLVDQSAGMWKWSGAGEVTYTDWATGQPNYWKDSQRTVEIDAAGKWNDFGENFQQSFYCSKLIEKTKLSWENALKHCQTKSKSLTGLTWDNERLLVKSQMQREGVGLVWIGLRFFGDQWQWVSGAPLESETQHELRPCPVQDRCGTLNSKGLLKSWDCETELYFICE